MKRGFKIAVLVVFSCLILILSGCNQQSRQINNIPEGDFWKEQGVEKVMDPWSEFGIDRVNGAFHTYLDRKWQPYNGTEKYPGMISRHIFSYSVEYMLTGNRQYLQKASELTDYLIQHAWDRKYGGWYDALDETGQVIDSTKDGFYQTYAVTGLAMYYMVTHDKQILDFIERSHEILTEEAWDDQYGGYYRRLNRDLSVKKDSKSFSPQLAPVSGYLIYLYLATRDKTYLQQMEKTMNLVLSKMTPDDSPWVLEQFSREWNYTYDRGSDGLELNTGHNAEVVWMLLRLYELTGNTDYRKEALSLTEPLYRYGYNDSTGIWYHRMGLQNPSRHSESSPWWIQAYGNMLSLYLYHQTGQDSYLNAFQRGASFWNDHFIDDEHGGAYLSVNTDGSILKGDKAVRTKTSYHSLEHALLNYLYTNLWVKDEPVTLYYFVDTADDGRKFYPIPIEGQEIEIQSVKIRGEAYDNYDPEKGVIRLPKGSDMEIEVTLTK